MCAGRNRGDPGVPISVSNTLAVSFNHPTWNSLISSPRRVHKRKAGRRSPTSPRSPHSVDQARNCGTAVLSPAHVAGHRSLKLCVLNCEASEGAGVVVRMGTVDQHRIEFLNIFSVAVPLTERGSRRGVIATWLPHKDLPMACVGPGAENPSLSPPSYSADNYQRSHGSSRAQLGWQWMKSMS